MAPPTAAARGGNVWKNRHDSDATRGKGRVRHDDCPHNRIHPKCLATSSLQTRGLMPSAELFKA